MAATRDDFIADGNGRLFGEIFLFQAVIARKFSHDWRVGIVSEKLS